jgi:hypothetical protein
MSAIKSALKKGRSGVKRRRAANDLLLKFLAISGVPYRLRPCCSETGHQICRSQSSGCSFCYSEPGTWRRERRLVIFLSLWAAFLYCQLCFVSARLSRETNAWRRCYGPMNRCLFAACTWASREEGIFTDSVSLVVFMPPV